MSLKDAALTALRGCAEDARDEVAHAGNGRFEVCLTSSSFAESLSGSG